MVEQVLDVVEVEEVDGALVEEMVDRDSVGMDNLELKRVLEEVPTSVSQCSEAFFLTPSLIII